MPKQVGLAAATRPEQRNKPPILCHVADLFQVFGAAVDLAGCDDRLPSRPVGRAIGRAALFVRRFFDFGDEAIALAMSRLDDGLGFAIVSNRFAGLLYPRRECGL
jgi:hypothetical protein